VGYTQSAIQWMTMYGLAVGYTQSAIQWMTMYGLAVGYTQSAIQWMTIPSSQFKMLTTGLHLVLR